MAKHTPSIKDRLKSLHREGVEIFSEYFPNFSMRTEDEGHFNEAILEQFIGKGTSRKYDRWKAKVIRTAEAAKDGGYLTSKLINAKNPDPLTRTPAREFRWELSVLEDLIDSLELLPTEHKYSTRGSQPSYDKATGVLTIGGREIGLRKSNRSGRQLDLCALVLKNKRSMSEGVTIEEVQVSWGNTDPKDWRAVYHAANELNKKILRETGLANFFLANSKEVKVDPSYL